jgi:signal transduction histidine kinase
VHSSTPYGGVLYLDHDGIAGLFGAHELGVLELIAGVIGAALRGRHLEAQARATQEELAETHRHIMRAERNRLAGELAAGLVHDLKNMLAAISGKAQLLRRANASAEVARATGAIEQATAAGTGLLRRLQECTRDHSAQSEEVVELVAIASEALELIHERIERQAVSATMRGAKTAAVRGVPGEYREMFLNLFVNACDAMPHGGALSVDFGTDPDAGTVSVIVTDTGDGMSPEVARRAFEPFFTTKGNQGTGLGLVIVRNAIVRRGGEIAAESQEGRGASFRITLPAASRLGARAGHAKGEGALAQRPPSP